MARFAYLGDHEEIALFGVRFPRGVAVEVSEEGAIAKLRGNSHFAEEFDGALVVDAEPPKRRGRPPKAK